MLLSKHFTSMYLNAVRANSRYNDRRSTFANGRRAMDERDANYEPTRRRRASAGQQSGSSADSPSPSRRTTREAATSTARPSRRATGSASSRQPRSTRPASQPRQPRQQHTTRRSTAISASSPLLSGKFIIIASVIAAALIAGIAFAVAGHAPDGDAPPASDASAPDGTTLDQATGKATEPYSVSFTTTGDLIFWREVADYIDANGGASAMANIADTLAQSDVTISNLESPLSDDESEPVTDKDVYIIGRPSAIESVKNSGIDVVSLANNHIMDYSGPALKDTLDALDGAGILHAGAGMTESQAETPAEFEVNGASVAFFSWTDIVPDYYLAFGDEPGVVSARMNMADACKRVAEAKQTHDIVIVAMHWGVEYEDNITDYLQSEPAHQLVDAGADVILGNHPHVMQGVEFYKGSLIAYAHGNCVFWQKYDHTHESIVLNFDMTQDGIQNVVATPLYLDDTYGIPDFASDAQATETLTRLQEISEGMNTAFDIRDGKAYISPLSGEAGSSR